MNAEKELFRAFSEKLQPCGREIKRAVFLGFGFVSAQSQGLSNLLLRQRPMIGTTRQNPKILAPHWLQFFFKRSNGTFSQGGAIFNRTTLGWMT